MNENESQSNERTFTEDLSMNTLEDNPEYRFQNACCLHTLSRKIFRCLFSLKRISSNAQKYVIWILIIILSLSGGLYLRCYVFQKRSMVLLPSDISVVDTILPLFCSSLSICYKGNKIKAYVLPRKPELNKAQVQHNYTVRFILKEENEKIWPINLQQNSSLSMRLCSEGLSEIGLITSKENFEKWESEKGCSRCLQRFTIGSTCMKFKLSQPAANMHYIVFRSIGKGSLIKADISLKRTLYKIQGSNFPIKKYNNCFKIPVKMQSSEYILLQFLSKQWEFISLTVEYNTRNYIFIIFFLVLPCFLGSLVFSMTERLLNNYSDEDLEDIEDNTSTLSVIEYIGSTNPPSYDTLFPENDPNTLPSYQKCAEIGIPKTS
ncbi:uncharacterized protein LOC106881168 [Octopus bimaculoides]|uniref:Uncharacterized protein n=1 Tax=Octopus bimaculoides TaxID=37653 RepID=A0A0L8FTY0_OCTBM|nr:uncharacterized protein LOC106881168 [Octopus bimaculoides]|eukprot:XP_014786944.1 PREDICTED: uncharacterized protein LOC106881168 [Octopus bimaculoides]